MRRSRRRPAAQLLAAAPNTLEQGRPIRVQEYFDHGQALQAAGVVA